MHERLKEELFPVEKKFIAGRPEFEKAFAALDAKNKAAAMKRLGDYVAAAFAKVADLTSQILARKDSSPIRAPGRAF